MFMMMTAGTIYGFPLWSSIFKDPSGYNLSQTQMELMGTFAHGGNYIVLDAGVINAVFGTQWTLVYGCFLCATGYGALWVSTAFFSGKVPYVLLLMFNAMWGHGCGSIDNASMTELLSAFPNHKGSVVGCIKCYYGLAGATVTVIYNAVFQPNLQDFLIFLACYAAISGVFLIPIVGRTKGLIDESNDRIVWKFRVLAVMEIVFTIYILVVNSLKPEINRAGQAGSPLWLALLCVLLVGSASLFILPKRGSACEEQALVSEQPERRPVSSLRNIGVGEMMLTADFWVLIVVLVIGQGMGLAFLNNSKQIHMAYTESDEEATTYIAMISCFNGLGRLFYGNLSEMMLPKVSRMWFLVLSCALLSLAYWLLILAGSAVLWPCGILTGLAYGGLWGVQPVILTELFGPKQYGVKYACSAMAAFAGSLIFATGLAGSLYDRASEKYGFDNKCLKPGCYDTFAAIAGSCGIVATFIAVGLSFLTARHYQHIRDQLNAGTE